MTTSTANSDRPYQSVRFGAASGDLLLRLLRDGLHQADAIFGEQQFQTVRRTDSSATRPAGYAPEDQFRATILASSPVQLRDRLTAALKTAETGRFRALLDRDRVVLWQTADEVPRVAWLFPGQGSHYAETPAVFSARECARRTLDQVDNLFAASNLPRLSTAFGNPAIRPGEDVWWAQAWVLGVSASLIDVLKSENMRPDAVLGHSFGEFTASLASGVTTLAQTIELARHRANSVMSHMRTPGGLLSVRAAVHEVDAILKSAALPVYVTHLNSPRQTVIAGSRDGITAAKMLLDRQGLASLSVSVPAPFHTPLLAEAEVAFERMSASVPMRPPTTGFLSATSVQYLAEPSGIRHSLVRQLTQPVMYMPSIQRMLGEGFRVLLEIGPNDVLTRMNRDIVDGHAICVSLDVPGQVFEERLQLVHAVLECVANEVHDSQTTRTSSGSLSVHPTALTQSPTPAMSAVFDVTKARRSVRKTTSAAAEESSHEVIPAASSPAFVASSSVASAGPPASDVKYSLPVQIPESSPAVSDAQLRLFVRDLVVELTGYSPDIIDFEADLEADLGVDSIKKAQILGELGEWLGLTVRPESLRLDSVKTLDDAVRVAQRLAAEAANSRTETATAAQQRTVPAAPFSSRAEPSAGSNSPFIERAVAVNVSADRSSGRCLPDDNRLDALLIDYVVDQTGYSRDIVDIDADLEADLGLDSIKLAQLIGEMREQFNLESLTLDSIAQARFRTLRGIREFLVSHDKGSDAGLDTSNPPDRSFPRQSGNGPYASSPDHSDSLTDGLAAVTVEPSGTNGHGGASSGFAKPWASVNHHDSSARSINGHTATTSALVSQTTIRGSEPLELSAQGNSEWLQKLNHLPQDGGAALQVGIVQGQVHQNQIRHVLRSLIQQSAPAVAVQQWSATDSFYFKGLAAGAGVSESSVRVAADVFRGRSQATAQTDLTGLHSSVMTEVAADDESPTTPASQRTHRFALRVVSAPRRSGMPLNPELHGAALILGANPVAESLAERIRQLGQKAVILDTALPIVQLEQTLDGLWEQTATPHLFLAMAFDADSAKTLRESDWRRRRPAALAVPFRICQLWMQRTIDARLMEDASVISVTQLGGDFGFSGQQVRSIEAIGGLVKAMLIEAWMRGFRTTPMKVVDVTNGMTPQEIASGVLQELAVPSYDMEIAFRSAAQVNEPERFSVQAMAAPLNAVSNSSAKVTTNRITPGATWIVSGGGRGITAVIAMTLAKKYDLNLQLLGTAPVPGLSDDFVDMVTRDRSSVRRSIMNDASARGENPVEAWRNAEKAIEIDATLRECRRQNVKVTYHCCDVSDFADVERTVRRIRDAAGPIRGVIHGAGAGQDARFDRKRPDKVEKCLQAKIDGSLALMQATNQDPLEWFVAFGSISGRFGANGHTDYSLANDMMAKIVDRFRAERPEVRSVTFHWHAWGDIGMATKPEAKLALEMIDMDFMPARDGIAHFMRELEFGGNEPEVLITDESYFRKFFPAERLSLDATSAGSAPIPLTSYPLIPSAVTHHADGVCSSVVTLNPVTDKFLSQHRVQGRPTLPFVVALELMAEAARVRTGAADMGVCLRAKAMQAIRFSTDDPLAITLQTRPTPEGGVECRLLADVRRRDGRMVEEDREYFRAEFLPRNGEASSAGLGPRFEKPVVATWKRIEYASPDSLIYHGPELQELREITDDGRLIFGRIAASAAVQLFGGARARGFTVPCATMDACLYAIGYAAWHRNQKASLPVQFDRIEFGRLPDPGEPCLVCIQQTNLTESGANWDFQLQGHNGDRLLTVTGYRIGWLKHS